MINKRRTPWINYCYCPRKRDLLALHRREERDSIQKSKLNLLKLGDENTSLFQPFLATKKKRSLIPKLVSDQGILTTSFSEIKHLILDFYSNLYEKSDRAGTFPSTFDWSIVSGDQNKKLTAKFSLLEIVAAINSLGRNKAPGEWKLNVCVEENFICLIKKKEDAIKVRDFRPISLTALLYKLTTKVL